jgi:predicted ArsR family transcriptional regulator
MFQHTDRTRLPPMLQHAREIAPSVSWEILGLVKRSGGMCVKELSAKLKMSYMGVKQHCDDLKRRGYLDTWRRPKKTGRPEKIYRPAEKLDLVLPSWSSELSLGLLSLVAQQYGETMPERLLYAFLQQKVERWSARIKGKKPAERAQELAKLRNADGWMCEVMDDAEGLRLVDHHSPMAEVARLYPALPELEVRVLSRIFGQTLQRRMNGPHVEFVISQPEAAPAAPVPPPPPVEEVKAVLTRRVTKAEKPPKVAPQPPKAAPQPPTREVLDLELIGSGTTSHRRHRDDLFEL